MRSLALVTLLLALFVGVRLVGIDAGTPASTPNRLDARELLYEPPASAHAARDFALFDAFAPDGDAEGRAQLATSPAWVVPLGLTLRAYGATFSVLRAFSTACAALGFLAVILLARARLRVMGVVAAAAFFGFGATWVLYTRAGFLEPNVCAFLTFAVLFVHRARRRVGWLAAAIAALAGAVLTMPIALFAAPFLVAFAAPAVARARGLGRWIPAALLACAAIAFVVYAARPDYAAAVELQPARALEVTRWGAAGFAAFGAPALLAAVQLARTARRAAAGVLAGGRDAAGKTDPWDAIVSTWAASAILVAAASPLASSRPWLLAFPPVALLAARAVDELRGGFRSEAARFFAPAIVVANATVWAAAPIVEALDHPSRDVLRARVRVRRAVDHPAARREVRVLGVAAGPIAFETPYRHVGATPGGALAALRALSPTHAIVLRAAEDPTRRAVLSAAPGLTPLQSFRLGEDELDLYALGK